MPTEPYNEDQGGGSPPLPPKFLYRDPNSGLVTEAFAVDGLTSPPSAYTIVSTNADGTIDPSLLPANTSPDYTGTAGEALSAGQFVYIDTNGDIFAASAGASPSVNGSEVGPNEAIGYVIASASQGATIDVYFSGINVAASDDGSDVGGLIVGKRTYLSTNPSTPGLATQTVPSGAGNLHQLLGYCKLSGNPYGSVDFDFSDAIVLAS